MTRPGDIFRRKAFPGSEQLGQFTDLCEEIGKVVTLQKVFNPELFPKNGSLRGLKRLSQEQRTQLLADKLVRNWYEDPNIHEVEMLLKAGVNTEYIHPQAERGATLLGHAARRGYAQCVDALLRHGADPTTQADNKMTPFQQAAYMGQVDVMKMMLAHGADKSGRTEDGFTPLMLVVVGLGKRDNCRRAIELLLALGASIDDKDNEGRTVMDHYNRNRNRYGYASMGWKDDWARPLLDIVEERAAREKKEEATERLMRAIRRTGSPGGNPPSPEALQRYIDDGADIERADDELWKTTPLSILSTYNCIEPVKTLIAAGANVSPRHPERGSTPITIASYFGYVDMLNLLLDNGANVNEADNDGKTTLMNAADRGCRRDAARLLVARGASVSSTDKAGKTALDYCAEGFKGDGNYGGMSSQEVFAEMQQVLLAGLHREFLRDRLPNLPKVATDADFATALLAANVDAQSKDANGWTALHWAAGSGNQPLMESLLSRGADINVRDALGRTPLMYAYLARNEGAAEFLLGRNALIDLKDARGTTTLDFARSFFRAGEIEKKRPYEDWPEAKKALQARIKEQFETQFENGAHRAIPVSHRLRLNKPSGGTTP